MAKHKKRYKKKKKKNLNPVVNKARDCHHILYQGKHWKNGYAKSLREFPYCKALIPRDTLHKEIHSKIHDIPVPNQPECRDALMALQSWMDAGQISLDDSLDKRLEWIAKCFRAKCPATTAMLDWQREVAVKFYGRGD